MVSTWVRNWSLLEFHTILTKQNKAKVFFNQDPLLWERVQACFQFPHCLSSEGMSYTYSGETQWKSIGLKQKIIHFGVM